MLAKDSAVTTDAPVLTAGLNRRQFLGGAGSLAALMAVGGSVLEPAFNPASQAAADEIGPLLGQARLEKAYEIRIAMADRMKDYGIPDLHPSNDDEDLYPNRIGNFSKGFHHDSVYGEVDPHDYEAFLEALKSGDPGLFEQLPLAGDRKLVNPQAGLAFDTEGNDPHQFKLPIAPAFASAEEAAEMVELYWMALLRDVPFRNYYGHPMALQAAAELTALPDFKGPRINGQVTPQTLFRDELPGALAGPYISQFMLRPTPFGAERVDRRMRTLVPGDDHMLSFPEWLEVQRGFVVGEQTFDPFLRYIRNGRDISQWVHLDVLFQAYFNACLILITPPDPDDPFTGGGIGCPPNPGNPYLPSHTQEGFGTWGPPGFKALMCEVASRALKAQWFHKWFVHRRLRPEAFGGRIYLHRSHIKPYPIHPSVLNSMALALTQQHFHTYLLPQVFPEGSPLHPSYGAGHATVAGACVTILKALFDERFPMPAVVVPNADGTSLEEVPTTQRLTVGGELNKLASNVATGRNIAGVHWRSDGINSLYLGEEIAINVLRDYKYLHNEGGSYIFTGFAGNPIII